MSGRSRRTSSSSATAPATSCAVRASSPSPRRCSSRACPTSAAIRARRSPTCSTSWPTPTSRCSSRMGIYFELSGSEAAAAALLGASINYPMRGAVTWKSVVGTNVASDALSHVASAGRQGRLAHRHRRGLRRGRLDPAGAHALRRPEVVDPPARSPQQPASRSRASSRRASGSRRRATSRCSSRSASGPATCAARSCARTTCGRAISMRSPLGDPSFSLERINLPPFTYAMEAQKFTERLPAAQRYIVEHRLNEHLPRRRSPTSASSCRAGCGTRSLRGLACAGAGRRRAAGARSRMLVLNALHPLVPEELIGFLRGKTHVLVVEEGMPNYIERELKALAHDARLDVEIHGKELLSPHGEYVPALVIGGLRKFLTTAPPRGDLGRRAIEDRYAALTAHASGRGRRCPSRSPSGRPRSAPAAPSGRVFSAMKILRTQGAGHRRHPRGGRHRLHDLLDPGAVQRRQLRARLRHGAGVGGRGGAATSASA